MGRYLAGAFSALLLVTVGVLWWTGRAEQQSPIPAAPKAMKIAAVQGSDELEDPPAASEKTREQRRFARYDQDENGIITRVEMLETRRKPFQKLDTNGDGKLSFEEWSIATADRFGKADADRSGTLTAAEFATTRRETRPAQRCSCET